MAFGGREYAVPRGHAFIALVPEASRYGYPASGREPWVFSWLNFYGGLALRLWGALREQSGPVVALAPATVREMEALIAKGRRRGWSHPYEASVAAYRFHLEVVRRLRAPEPAQPLARAAAYLRAHYQEPLRVKELAALAQMSREHFSRLFFKQMGESPAAFLRGLRMEAAARLLRSTRLPVAEVAFQCGFSSATKLGLFFRRRYGSTPMAYRRAAQRPPEPSPRPGRGRPQARKRGR